MTGLADIAASAKDAADTAHAEALAAKDRARTLAGEAAAAYAEHDLEQWKQVQVDAGYTPVQDSNGNWGVREADPGATYDDQAG